jgi:dTDP-4-dehydrorhamnose reductase
MKVLVTGAGGQLAEEFFKRHPNSPHQYEFVSKAQLDITKPLALQEFFEKHSFDCVLNAAAFTAVDRAETEPELAMEVNAKGPQHLAKLSEIFGFLLIQFSTDFVFDGTETSAYRVDAPTHPLNVYGLSKREGEIASLQLSSRSLVIRTSWLYSCFGKNFVKSIRKMLLDGKTLKIVSDQRGSPTYAENLARWVDENLVHLDRLPDSTVPRIFHFSDEGEISWYEFALQIAKELQLPNPISPISTAEYGAPAKRPPYSRLDISETKKFGNSPLEPWDQALSRMLHHLQSLEKTSSAG